MGAPRARNRHWVGAVTAVAAAGLLATVTPSALAASGSGEGASRSGVYIVTLEQGTASTSAAGKTVATRYGTRIQHTYSAVLNGYAVRATAEQARKLAADPAVAKVVADERVRGDLGTRSAPSLGAAQTNPPWGLDRIDQKSLPLNKKYSPPASGGAGATVYVLDTGVRTSHKDFGGRAKSGWDFVQNDAKAQDGNGHGTHVAGTVAGAKYGVAKKAKIVAVRVLDDEGSGTLAQVIAGIDWVTRHARKPAVANMSLAGPANAQLDAAVRKSIAKGITYSIAAGNAGEPATNWSPGRVKEAITVGASDRRDKRPSFSNYGGRLDLFAPGVAIRSASHLSDTGSVVFDGTSMAAPHVAGAAALYLGTHPTAKPDKVSKALTDKAVKNKLSGIGSGSPNRLLQVK
ncbi:S8 family peptidase [Streptomyces sp. NPDC059063]|uniref:S8 family peptidase n=1 Tax=unclassified Streptomyces TaxID=2593676 RepID=UPI00367A5009